jgi:hypothetical protein
MAENRRSLADDKSMMEAKLVRPVERFGETCGWQSVR